ncbi:MAG: 30S ribosomal protein S20 [Elusimicrobia bacterium]|nr:30S ribosomal protein S20 [Elusimicrobiota bacterium]MBU2614507.1 30S ribosomal protein S20 [Elusimicrobiota bacterium]
MAKLKTGRHTSSIKELRKSKKRQKFNKDIKEGIKLVIKQIKKAIANKSTDEAKKLLSEAVSKLDKAAKHNIFHPNATNRKKSQIMRLVNSSK